MAKTMADDSVKKLKKFFEHNEFKNFFKKLCKLPLSDFPFHVELDDFGYCDTIDLEHINGDGYYTITHETGAGKKIIVYNQDDDEQRSVFDTLEQAYEQVLAWVKADKEESKMSEDTNDQNLKRLRLKHQHLNITQIIAKHISALAKLKLLAKLELLPKRLVEDYPPPAKSTISLSVRDPKKDLETIRLKLSRISFNSSDEDMQSIFADVSRIANNYL